VRIDGLLAAGRTTSFEFFPPKDDHETSLLERTLGELEDLRPAFVSVTYRGGRISRQPTFELVNRIQSEFSLVAMAHLICVGHRRDELMEILHDYLANGVVNLMALGGDPPTGDTPPQSDLAHASELVELARGIGDFCIGVAAHPAGHPRSANMSEDRDRLADKMRLADFAVTQFFFEAHEWLRLVEDLSDRGVDKPVLPGIMPVTTISGIERMATMGARVPESLLQRLHRAHDHGGPGAVRAEGVTAATELCEELLERKAPGLHFYTLNKSTATREISARLTKQE
jgi:methylenetetrahydrofolate reductase (NADPH)